MHLEVYFENTIIAHFDAAKYAYIHELKELVSQITNVPGNDLYATQNGRPVSGPKISGLIPIRFSARVVGGKGGFGSMLRAIGAQIEKTTNREACRDLSGRRLRDIREERRLREWAANNPQRTEDAARRKEERLKRLCAVPSHEFQDPAYEEARKRLEEDGDASLQAGLEARLAPNPTPSASEHSSNKKRKPNLWIDEDMSDLSSSESGCEDDGSQESGSSEEPERSSNVSVKGKGRGKRSFAEALGTPASQSDAASKANKISAGNDSGNESDIKTV